MEKNRILDPCSKAFIVVLLATAICSCSIPRIAVLHDPLTPQEHVDLGLSYEKNREFHAALKEYETAAKKLPIAYLYIGNVQFEKKEFEKAENSYKKAIEKTQSPHAYNNLAWLYYSLNRNLAEAEALAKKAVELSPETEDFKDTLVKIQERQKEHTSPVH